MVISVIRTCLSWSLQQIYGASAAFTLGCQHHEELMGTGSVGV